MIDEATRQRVRSRAGDRCEYCHLSQAVDPFFRFHVEHIVAVQHGGSDDLSNLALACPHCNLHKGPNLAGIDPETGQLVPLFNPRTQRWRDHFAVRGIMVEGQTPVGRATVVVLAMNADEQQELRADI